MIRPEATYLASPTVAQQATKVVRTAELDDAALLARNYWALNDS